MREPGWQAAEEDAQTGGVPQNPPHPPHPRLLLVLGGGRERGKRRAYR